MTVKLNCMSYEYYIMCSLLGTPLNKYLQQPAKSRPWWTFRDAFAQPCVAEVILEMFPTR